MVIRIGAFEDVEGCCLVTIMGGCVSKPNKKLKSKAKCFYKSCRLRRKIAPSSPFAAPLYRHADGELCDSEFSFQDLVLAHGGNIGLLSEVQSLPQAQRYKCQAGILHVCVCVCSPLSVNDSCS